MIFQWLRNYGMRRMGSEIPDNRPLGKTFCYFCGNQKRVEHTGYYDSQTGEKLTAEVCDDHPAVYD